MARPLRECPNEKQHERGPDDYSGRAEWAERKARTHTQQQCCCGLWLIWEPKKPAALQTKEGRE